MSADKFVIAQMGRPADVVCVDCLEVILANKTAALNTRGGMRLPHDSCHLTLEVLRNRRRLRIPESET